eukprot:4630141-Amphidinium_carterae.1
MAGLAKLVVHDSASGASTDISTVMRLKHAMIRRAVAFDAFNLLDLHVHSKWIEFLFLQITRRTLDGHFPVTIQQLVEADKQGSILHSCSQPLHD